MIHLMADEPALPTVQLNIRDKYVTRPLHPKHEYSCPDGLSFHSRALQNFCLTGPQHIIFLGSAPESHTIGPAGRGKEWRGAPCQNDMSSHEQRIIPLVC